MRTNYLHEILSHPQSSASPYCSPCLASPTCPTLLPHLFLNCNAGELCVCEKSAVIDTELYANRINVSLSPVLKDAAAEADEAVVAVSGVAAGALEVTARIDTGATCHNFISEGVANKLIMLGSTVSTGLSGVVCSAFRGAEGSRSFDRSVLCKLGFFNLLTRSTSSILIEAVIIQDLSAPLIIGLQTIGKHRLIPQCLPSLCTPQIPSEEPEHLYDPTGLKATGGERPADVRSSRQEQHAPRPRSDQPRCGLQARGQRGSCELCAMSVSSKDFFGAADDSESDDEASTGIADMLPQAGGPTEEVNIEDITFDGSAELQARLRSLCEEFKDVFASSVRPQAAHVPPMVLEIDADKLRASGRGRGNSPRPQSREKLDELKAMIEELLRLGVIRCSTADTASQVLLVAKKGTTKLRFCIDYRAINDATVAPEGWPLPNIKTMLERLGAKKPRFFGVMDLTSGYHQAPLSESGKRWSAFVTAFGTYEWNRVPMGLMGAPSYFQRVMATNVLGDLLMRAVEVYLDDFIVFGLDEDEFVDNLRATLARCRTAFVTLNPKKCRFGLSRIEYVGHTIDSTGISFSREKLDSVVDMPKPKNKGEMKTFLGMVTYFHSHIANLSSLEAPLVAMIGEKYTKRLRGSGIQWTAAGEKSFTAIKEAIDNCPKLWFRDDSLPVYLQTDASDYGVGAYMFQILRDGTHLPIEFISRSLSGAQRRWSVADKEAYAIFYAFKRWEHHLRDRPFILQTDHKNLTYVNFEGSAKVKRWKMLIQEYRFQIEYLPGPQNVVSDAFSRCCAKEEVLPATPMAEAIEREYLEFLEAAGEDECFMGEEAPIPDSIRKEIERVHNAMVGHAGIKRTVKRLVDAGSTTRDQRGWVTRFIHECPFCQKQSYRRELKSKQPFTLAQTQRVMQRLNLDAIGPIDEDKYGYQYVLTVIDTFSRWVMTYPLRTLESEEIIRALIQHIGIFGAPVEWLTDNGSSLKSKKVREIVELLNMTHKLTTAYSHEENAIVERSNHEVIRYLRAMVYDDNTTERWSDLLPFAQRICNAEVVSSIGVSPAQIIFGAAINLDRGILVPNTPVEEHDHPVYSDYVNGLIKAQQAAIEFARDIQATKDAEHIAEGRGRAITEFKIGDFVTLSYPANQDGKSKPPSKLMTKRRGPFEVLSFEGPIYKCRNLGDNKVLAIHVNELEIFRYDVAHVDPQAVAAKDQREFVVEAIVEHRPTHQPTRHRKQLEFLIKWKDYDESENSWVGWHELTNNNICHAYCMANQMRSLVHKRYRGIAAAAAEDDGEESDA